MSIEKYLCEMKKIHQKSKFIYDKIEKFTGISNIKMLTGRYILWPYAIRSLFSFSDEKIVEYGFLAQLLLDHYTSMDMVYDKDITESNYIAYKYCLINDIYGYIKEKKYSEEVYELMAQSNYESINSYVQTQKDRITLEEYRISSIQKYSMIKPLIFMMCDAKNDEFFQTLVKEILDVCYFEQLIDDFKDFNLDKLSGNNNYFTIKFEKLEFAAVEFLSEMELTMRRLNQLQLLNILEVKEIFVNDNIKKKDLITKHIVNYGGNYEVFGI